MSRTPHQDKLDAMCRAGIIVPTYAYIKAEQIDLEYQRMWDYMVSGLTEDQKNEDRDPNASDPRVEHDPV